MSRMSIALLTTALAAVAAIAGFIWWGRQPVTAPPPMSPPAVEAPVAIAPPPEVPAIQYPIPDSTEPEPLPSLDKSDRQITSALSALLGQKSVLTFIQPDGFIRRVVATVDNLPRTHAAPRLWPVNPTGGRFAPVGPEGSKTIGTDNSLRYAPLLVMLESVNARHATAVYVRFYPLFQKAYEELGYPGKYFNDRLVAVIDHLLSTPEPSGPIAVRLVEVKGPQKQIQPWVHYEYADPALEQLSSGQKVLVRMGLVNERRAKVKLRELRAAVTNAAQDIKASAATASAPR